MSSGATHFMASNNDCGIRDFDMERFQLTKHFSFPWPVNVSISYCFFCHVFFRTESPRIDGKLMQSICGSLVVQK